MQQNRFHYGHQWCSVELTVLGHLIQLLLCVLLHASYVIHRQTVPFVEPAEQLSVELGEQAVLHLGR